ncbi:MAG: O-antigen ligase family protein [Gammaproteobacteria bacterium]|nr:O-antigen ligase family protein [Gammaproteobacteria bacterium]
MRKIISSYTSLVEPFILILALILAMLYQGGGSFISQWFSITLLWGLVLWRLRQPNLYFPLLKDKAFLIYALFIAWTVLAGMFWSVAKALSIFNSSTFLGGLLTYFIGYTSNDKSTGYFYRILLGVGLVLVCYTFYQAFILHAARPSGMLGNWNTHAALLAMILIPGIVTYTLQPSASIRQLGFWLFMTLLFAFAMGLTQSRGALLIFVTVAVCLNILAWRQKLSINHGLFFLLAALCIGYLLNGLLVSDSIVQRIGAIAESDSLVALGSGRHLLWLPAWDMYLDRPYLGWGLGTFYLLYAQYKPPLSDDAGFFAHNDYLQILLELGPVGLIIFLFFIFILCKRLYNLTIKRTADFSAYKVEAFALLATCVGIMVHTFFTFHLYQLTIQILWGYFLGRSARNIAMTSEAPEKPIPQKLTGKTIWLYRVLNTLVIMLIVTFGLSFYYTFRAANTENQQQALEYDRLSGLFFPLVERYEFFSAQNISTLLQQDKRKTETLKRRQVANLALSRIDTAVSKMSANAEIYHTKAEIIQEMQGSISTVSKFYEKSLLLDPYQLMVRDEYARYLIINKQYKKALSVLWGAWGLLNNEFYQNGVMFLNFQLRLNKVYGKPEDNLIILNEIQRLSKLRKNRASAGKYVFTHPAEL